MSIRTVMYLDTLVNVLLLLSVLASAPLLVNALSLPSNYPIYGVAVLFGASALSHWIAGRTQSRAAVRVMMVMDGCAAIGLLFLAALNPMAAPIWLRAALLAGAFLAVLMGWLKLVTLRSARVE